MRLWFLCESQSISNNDIVLYTLVFCWCFDNFENEGLNGVSIIIAYFIIFSVFFSEKKYAIIYLPYNFVFFLTVLLSWTTFLNNFGSLIIFITVGPWKTWVWNTESTLTEEFFNDTWSVVDWIHGWRTTDTESWLWSYT